MLSRRRFLASVGVVAGTAQITGPSKLFANIKPAKVPALQPPFRLDVDWYRNTVRRFQAILAEKGLSGAIVSDVLNRNYLTGIFLTETERPNYLFVPAKGDPIGFIPGLDRDMAASWWVKDFEWYFDFPHAGGYNGVQWKAGKREDLFVWMLKGLSKRGFGDAKLGMDREPAPSLSKKFKDTLPEATLADVSADLLAMRQVKTPEEIALLRKALALHDAMLQFARSFILEHGTSVTLPTLTSGTPRRNSAHVR